MMRSLHAHGPSDTSSLYSSVLSINEDDPNSYTFPPARAEKDPFQVSNPYADSLWYKTRGESGNDTIGDIQKRSKRKLEENPTKPPLRLESQGIKKVDSPIRSASFFHGFDDVECPSPKYKGLDKCDTPTDCSPELKKYRSALKELIVTEMKYHEDILLTDTIYRSLLQNSRKYKHILSSRQESVIFSNLETITDLSGLFIRDVNKAMSSCCAGYFEFDIEKHFNLVKILEVDIGDYLKSYFIRLRIAYTSYFTNHKTQMDELEQCTLRSGPKVTKWLEECAYLARSKSDCWNLESLLIKPIQRLPKYLLMIDVLLENSEELSYEFVENLCDAKSYLEKLLDELNSGKNRKSTSLDPPRKITNDHVPPRDPSKSYIGRFFEGSTTAQSRSSSSTDDSNKSLVKPTTSHTDELRLKQERSMHQLKESRQEYVDLVNQFKLMYGNLKKLRKEMKEASKPLFEFVDNHKKLTEKWRTFMEYEDSEMDDYYIRSIYSAYSEKVSDQQQKTKLLANEIDEKIIKAIGMTLDNCSAVKYRIRKHNGKRGAYVRYLNDQNHMAESVKFEAQEYIVVENQIKDDLPPMLEKMSSFIHYISLSYTCLFQSWLKMLSGSPQLEQYQELLKFGEIEQGDNFDIIEMYSSSKHNTKTALKDMCAHSPYSAHTGDISMKIHSSRVVRRLFGI